MAEIETDVLHGPSVETALSAAATRIEHHLAGLFLDSSHTATSGRLIAAMRHAVLGGGKRFRPFLVYESAALFGVAPAAATATAASLELLHCYSLAHDDLPAMDDDDLRRGQPTVHKAFDEWTAILAGDGLQTLAFELLAAPACHPDPAVRAALVLELARASGPHGMVGGQALDLESDKLGRPAEKSLAHVRNLQAKKTGALITYACEAGAILGSATPRERAALRTFGDEVGLAFQIADDLLDAEGDATTVGKAVGKDEAANKATLVSLLGPAEARNALAETVSRATAALEMFGPRAATLKAAARFVAERNR